MINFTNYHLHDLTHTYTQDMPGVSWEQARTRVKDGWNARWLRLYSHVGTHMDAPRHFDVNDGGIEDFTPEQLTGRAWVVKVPITEYQAVLGVDILASIGARWQAGDSLLLHTGWDEHLQGNYDRFRNGLPRISVELAHWCVANGVKMLGVEPPSVADVNNLKEVTEIHEILLSGGVIIIEGLTNLNNIKRELVDLIALPLKIAQGDGAPARVIALEERTTQPPAASRK
ncbi:MAG: cyclase family protein [Lewinella sp.]